MRSVICPWCLAFAAIWPLAAFCEEPDYTALSLGVSVVSLDEARQVFKDNDVRLPRRNGVLIIEVVPYGPAHAAGALPGDLVVSIDGQTVNTPAEYQAKVRALDPKRSIELLASRLVTVRNRQTWKTANPKVKPAPLREVLLAGLNSEEDKVRGVRFLRHKDSPDSVNERSEIFAYITEEDGQYGLRLKSQYVAEDWLFIEKMTFKVGNETYAIAPGFLNFKRDNSAGKIWEWCDLAVNQEQLAMLEKVAGETADVILRYEGDTYRKDRTLSDDEKQRLRIVVMAYQMLRQKKEK